MGELMSVLPGIGLGELCALGSAISWAVAVILFRHTGQGLPAFELNLLKNAVGLSLLLPTALIIAGPTLPGYRPLEWGLVLLSGYLGIAVADTWYLHALRLLGAGRTGVVASLYSPFVIVLSVVFLGERLRLTQIPGFILILSGILLVTWRQSKETLERQQLLTGLAYGAGGVLLMAAGIVMVKGVLEQYEFLWTVVFRLVSGLAGMLIVLSWRRQWPQVWARFQQPLPWPGLLVACVLGTYVSMLLWLAGYRFTLASVASILNETAATFIVIFAWLFLKEPINPRKLLGVACALGGAVLLILT